MDALQGIRVLEIGTSVAAPFAGEILSALGADVIKIEPPGKGDDCRTWGPPFWNDESVAFLSLNRGKRSIALNFRSERGAEVMTRLVAGADVVIQNARPGSIGAAGFGYATCADTNPSLIYCDMSGFGPVGPRASHPGYDPLLQAYSGIADITGGKDGAPVRVPVSLLDMGTAMWSVIGIVGALLRRQQTGVGCHVEASLLETAFGWLSSRIVGVLAGHKSQQKLGSGFLSIVPYGAFECSDGWIFISAGNDKLWRALCDCLRHPEMARNERFKTNPDRVRNRNEVNAAIQAVTQTMSCASLLGRLGESGVPSAPVNSIEQAIADDQVKALGIVRKVDHPRIADFGSVSLPLRADGEYVDPERIPPLLGEHTIEILEDIGYDSDDIGELLRLAVVEASPRAEPDGSSQPDSKGGSGDVG